MPRISTNALAYHSWGTPWLGKTIKSGVQNRIFSGRRTIKIATRIGGKHPNLSSNLVPKSNNSEVSQINFQIHSFRVTTHTRSALVRVGAVLPSYSVYTKHQTKFIFFSHLKVRVELAGSSCKIIAIHSLEISVLILFHTAANAIVWHKEPFLCLEISIHRAVYAFYLQIEKYWQTTPSKCSAVQFGLSSFRWETFCFLNALAMQTLPSCVWKPRWRVRLPARVRSVCVYQSHASSMHREDHRYEWSVGKSLPLSEWFGRSIRPSAHNQGHDFRAHNHQQNCSNALTVEQTLLVWASQHPTALIDTKI